MNPHCQDDCRHRKLMCQHYQMMFWVRHISPQKQKGPISMCNVHCTIFSAVCINHITISIMLCFKLSPHYPCCRFHWHRCPHCQPLQNCFHPLLCRFHLHHQLPTFPVLLPPPLSACLLIVSSICLESSASIAIEGLTAGKHRHWGTLQMLHPTLCSICCTSHPTSQPSIWETGAPSTLPKPNNQQGWMRAARVWYLQGCSPHPQARGCLTRLCQLSIEQDLEGRTCTTAPKPWVSYEAHSSGPWETCLAVW